MAGPLSPVLDEAYIRTRARGGYNDDTYDTLGRGLSNAIGSGTNAYVSYQEGKPDEQMAALGQELSRFIQDANQTNDITGRPLRSKNSLLQGRAALVARATELGPEALRFATSSLDAALGGELGLIGGSVGLAAEEASLQAALERGLEVGGLGISDEQAIELGQRAIRHDIEMEQTKERIALAQAQINLDSSTFNYNQARIKNEAEMYAARFQAEALQPLFQGVANSNNRDPNVLATNKQLLIQKQAEVEAALRQNLTELGVPAGVQSTIMGNINSQFALQQSGLELMAGVDATRLDQLQAVTQLSEVEMGTYLGRLISLFGATNASNLIQTANVIDPKVASGLGTSMADYLNGAERVRGTLGLVATEENIPQASAILGNSTPLSDPTDLKTLADASRTMVIGALDSDYQSQLNAIDMMSDPLYLENLKKSNDQTAISQVALFQQEMATRLATMMGQITSQIPDIEIVPNEDGTISPEIESWVESLKDIGGAALSAPPWMPNFISENLPSWLTASGPIGVATQGFSELADRSTYSQLTRMVDAYNKAITTRNALAPSLSRGLRNNNPGNLRPGNNWQGEVPSSDPGFEQFRDPGDGIRAMGKVIQNNSDRTVRQLIERYAPRSENNTDAYLTAVEAAGISLDSPVSEASRLDLAKVIIKHENGVQPFSDDYIESLL